MIPTETWLPVTDYPGYEVSDQGRVRSLDREVASRWGTPKKLKGRVLSPTMSGGTSSYPTVDLYRDGIARSFPIHVLMLTVFISERPDGCYGCHADDVATNNTLSNLYWGTPTQNNRDAVANGLNWKRRITHCPQGHEYTPENTYVVAKSGHRQCRTCIKARNKGNANADKTHCPQGHEYTPENTRKVNGRRACVTCNRDRAREYQRRKRSVEGAKVVYDNHP